MSKVYDPFCTFCGSSDVHADTCKFHCEPEETVEESYFTVVFVEGDFAMPAVGDYGNDFSAYKVVSLTEGDCRQEAMLLQTKLRTAEKERDECSQEYASLLKEHRMLREAASLVVKHKWMPLDKVNRVYEVPVKAIKELQAALQEGKEDG